jgi:hypothetical protein
MSRSALRMVGSLVGIAGVAFSLTLLSRSMRSVEKIGGFCASGGPYQIAHQCPKGVTGLLPLSIVGGLIFLALFGICTSDRGRSVLLLSWSALFLTLGWNFIYFGVVNPINGDVSYGQLIPGILFIIMGGVPLVWVVPAMYRALFVDDEEAAVPAGPTAQPWVGATSGVGSSTETSTTPTWPTATWPTTTPTVTTPTRVTTTPKPSTDVASELEKLASLHGRGELTDSEYEEAKRRAIGGAS